VYPGNASHAPSVYSLVNGRTGILLPERLEQVDSQFSESRNEKSQQPVTVPVGIATQVRTLGGKITDPRHPSRRLCLGGEWRGEQPSRADDEGAPLHH
jgi:hypothetical protein